MAKINQIEIGGSTYDLQDKSFFTGTTAEVTAAIAAGTIKEGDIVNVTDDNTKGSSNTVLDSLEEIKANTSPGIAAGALAVKEIATELGEDINGMTIHEKLDYIMQNGTGGGNDADYVTYSDVYSTGESRTLTLNEDWVQISEVGMVYGFNGRLEIQNFVAPRTLHYKLINNDGYGSAAYTIKVIIKGTLA